MAYSFRFFNHEYQGGKTLFVALVVFWGACRQNHQQSAVFTNESSALSRSAPKQNQDTGRPLSMYSGAESEEPANGAKSNWEIIPGERMGQVVLGMDAERLIQVFGQPDISDAAMGKAWMTWYEGRDHHNNRNELNVYTAYGEDMTGKVVYQIRITSPKFSTRSGIQIYDNLQEIKSVFPQLVPVGSYTDEGRTITIYDGIGIGFETVSVRQEEICVGILVQEKGQSVMDTYLSLHPSLDHL